MFIIHKCVILLAFTLSSIKGSCGYVSAKKNISNSIDWTIDDNQLIRWDFKCDIIGQNIESETTSEANCELACLSRGDCIGFVWTRHEGGTCWLKSNGYPITANIGSGGVCGEIIGRMAPPGIEPSDAYKRKSKRACNDYRNLASNYRILIGKPVERDEFPWMAALGYLKNKRKGIKESNIEFGCGGTVISDFYILTAAHCTEDRSPKVARLGTNFLNDTKKSDYIVERTIEHPDFILQERKNDIALVKVKQRITFNSRIMPACLRTDRADLPWDQELVVSGWGGIGDGTLANEMKKTYLTTVDLETCKENYLQEGSKPKDRIVVSQYCASDINNRDDVCRGDSGGPLSIFGDSPVPDVVGVVSFGKGCPARLPGVYTRVAHYVNWIEENAWES